MVEAVDGGRFIAADVITRPEYAQAMARLASGGFVYTWNSETGSGPVLAQLFDDSGIAQGGPITLAASGVGPQVVGLSNGGFAAAWVDGQSEQNVDTAAFDASGAPIGVATGVNATSYYMASDLQLSALDNGGYVVGWLQRNPNFVSSTYSVREVSSTGAALGAPAKVSSLADDAGLVTLADGRVLVAFASNAGGQQPYSITVRAFDPQTSHLAADNFIQFTLPADVVYADVALTQLASGKLVVSWEGQTNSAQVLHGAIYDLTGTATGDAFAIPVRPGYDRNSIAALDDGKFVVSFQNPDANSTSAIEAQIFNSNAQALGSAFVVNDVGQEGPDVPITAAFGTDDFAVAWSNGYGPSGNSSVRSFFNVGPAPGTIDDLHLITLDGFVGSVAGNGEVFGTNGFQDVTVLDQPASLVFDASFSRGGDIVRLPGAASHYIVSLSGSSAIITDGDTSVALPVGIQGMPVVFADGTRLLAIDTVSQTAKIGAQAITETAEPITAPASNSSLPTGGDASVTGRLVLLPHGSGTVEGKVNVFGTNGAEHVTFLGGAAVLDGSFSRGGDTLSVGDPAQDYTAYSAGSNVILTSSAGTAQVPVGIAGIVLDFAGDHRTMLLDAASGAIMIGNQTIDATSAASANHLDTYAPLAVHLEAGVTSFA